MNANAFDDNADSGRIDQKMRMLELLLLDVLQDASLADLIPDDGPYLDLYPRGARSDVPPDFQTPHVDVYVTPPQALPANHRIPWRTTGST